MELKIAMILTLTSTFLGFIIALTMFSAMWALLFIPHVIFTFALVRHLFKEERNSHVLVKKYSSFVIEQRVSYEQKPGSDWVKVQENIDTLKEADTRLEILLKDYQPEKGDNGNPVFVDWRIVQSIQGVEIYDRSSREVPLPPEAKLQVALDKLDEALSKSK